MALSASPAGSPRPTNGWFRRVSPVDPRPREGPLTEPTAGVQPWPRERVLMPHCGHCPDPVAEPQSGEGAVIRIPRPRTQRNSGQQSRRFFQRRWLCQYLQRMARRATAASATVCRFATGHRCSPHRIKHPAGLPRVGYSARLTKPRNPIGRGPCGFHRGSCSGPICRTPQKGEPTSKNPAQCLSQLIVLAYET
jgi:hypothetical protein